jgi:hypothetical protein
MRRLMLVLVVVLAAGCQEAEPVISTDEVAPPTTEATYATTSWTKPSAPETTVPRLVGKTFFKAEQLLGDARLVMAVEGKVTTQVPAGTVLHQVPRPGVLLQEGSLVRLLVSRAFLYLPPCDPRGRAITQQEVGRRRCPSGPRTSAP